MARILPFQKYRNSVDDRVRNDAMLLIAQAAETLAPLGEQDERVAWLLDDCLDLLRRPVHKLRVVKPIVTPRNEDCT